ncbi:MAG: bifunctional glycosyltransferase family 2 protein/CDP-glycerol:glycerophosphate glycerophosphotransferase [Deltaproteobacteria bacterium]|jgi:glycosyltransferase involved in cell wall biosynthesis|nr:bifunctional glycosyltransferase family 2 protein/CDP-glycerol:glycerophosphate glycerophosphotransferase [Deltaproteobacteria bacterium]
MTAVSVVVALHNAQSWLERFVVSLQKQSFKDFEAIFIDDASTDQSAAMLEGFASGDQRFRLLRHSQNCGAGVARNLGIRSALGETVCFADPDDLLPEHSLEVRYAAYKKHQAVVRACHDEITGQGALLNHETRPENLARVCDPARAAARVGVNPFLCAHWTWLLPTGLLRRQNIFHGENMRTADDIVMLARLFFHISRLVWIPETVYYWIKRADSLSTACYTPEHYADYFRCCDIFYEEAEQCGQVRLADMFFNDYCRAYLNHFLGQTGEGKSGEAEAGALVAEMAGVCQRRGVLARCLPQLRKNPLKLAGIYRLWRILQDDGPSFLQKMLKAQNAAYALLRQAEYQALRKAGRQQEADFDKFDQEQGLLRARYLFCDAPPEERLVFGKTTLAPAFAKSRKVFDGEDYAVFERILWLPVPQGGEEKLSLLLEGKNAGLEYSPADIRRAFALKPPDKSALPPKARALRRLASSKAMRERFKDAWMFMDRDTRADDNAEHLYRWVLRNHPEINAWFVLREESPDWPRLLAEGFRLIPFDGLEHDVLFLLAKNLVSSQMDRYIYARLDDRLYGDIRACKYVSLQHGVTKEDISPWINEVDMDLFVTATRAEYHSIIDDGTSYALTAREVVLSGFPRHDALLFAPEPEKLLFVMPTWRAELAGKWDLKGQRRERNPKFAASGFVGAWRSLLCSAELAELCRALGYQTVFWPHPGFEDYLADFSLPEHIRTPSGQSIQTLLKRSALLITDYSSIAFDLAFMFRPVLYCQFDDEAGYAKGQNRRRGYFSYERDGFGPVCRTEKDLLACLEKTLRANCRPEEVYLQRMQETFALRDGKCCERTFAAILALRGRGGEQ